MSDPNSAHSASPFSCPFPGCATSYNPAFSQTHSNHPGYTPTAPWNNYAPSPYAAGYTPSHFGWNPTPWFNTPSAYSSFDWNNTPWFNGSTPNSSFSPNNPAWFGSFSPTSWANPTPNNWHSPNSAWPQSAWHTSPWNHHNSFSPYTNSYTPSTSPWSWFANPNFHPSFNHPPFNSNYEASTPWFGPAFGGSAWFAPHNWTAPHTNPSWSNGNPTNNANHPTPSPYAVANPSNTNSARDAA